MAKSTGRGTVTISKPASFAYHEATTQSRHLRLAAAHSHAFAGTQTPTWAFAGFENELYAQYK